jgi:hypothetical protein
MPIGTAMKFTVPATSGGHLYVGTDGKVFGFGDPRPAVRARAAAGRSPAGASPSSLRFGTVALGKSVTRRIVITNRMRRTETITRITGISGPFSITGISGAKIAPGRSVTIDVTYTPKAARTDSRSLVITGSPGATLTFPMRARGVAG